jgi:hypothetical protein
MDRNSWFSVKDCGVGGNAVVVPMATLGFGGFVSRYVRRLPLLKEALGKTFWKHL